jgi:G3E family GTPase
VIDGRGELPVEALLDVGHGVTAGRAARPAEPRARHSGYRALSLADDGAIYDAGRLEDLIERLPEGVFRAKGVVRVGPGRFAAWNVVGGRVDFVPDAPAPAHGGTRIVLIGPELDDDALRAAFAACRADA